MKTTNSAGGSIVMLAVATLIAVCEIGCSSGPVTSSAVELHPVSGTVTLNNTPLDRATLMFIPIEGEGTRACYATTDMSGAFEVISPEYEAGCPAGKYRVTVSKYARADGSPLPPDTPGDVAAAEAVEVVPAPYNDAQTSTLEAIVTSGGAVLTFELKS